MKALIFALAVATLATAACTRKRAGGNASPFVEEAAPYTLAFVFDLGEKTRDRVIGDKPEALKYALDVKDTYFRDRSEATDRLLIAQVSGSEKAVLWDGRPRTFKKEFPDPATHFKEFLIRKANATAGPYRHTYDAVADTFDYLLKFRSRGKTAVLVFSDMEDRSPDPAKSRSHLVGSLAAYSQSGGHCAFYWLSVKSCTELEAIGREAGLTFGSFIPDAVRDPVRPTFLD